MHQLIPARCRRCNRLLRDHLSARAGVGPLCAQYEAAEAADSPVEARPAPDAHATAIAAVTACVEDVPAHVLQGIVDDAGADVTLILIGMMAYAVEETAGGREWLRRLALDWAAEGAV